MHTYQANLFFFSLQNKKYPSIDMEALGDIPLFNFLRFPEAELDAQNVSIELNYIKSFILKL